jgi:hypothetical protein
MRGYCVCVCGGGEFTRFVISDHYVCIYNFVFVVSYMHSIESLMELKENFYLTYIMILISISATFKEN